MTNIIQTIAILFTLAFTVWQWHKTRETLKVDNYSKLISALNDIRKERLARPELEKALFHSRSTWENDRIRKHLYGVMMANILEWSMISHESSLIDCKQWGDWLYLWKKVILSDPTFGRLMSDESVYSFHRDAHKLVLKLLEEIKTERSKAPLTAK